MLKYKKNTSEKFFWSMHAAIYKPPDTNTTEVHMGSGDDIQQSEHVTRMPDHNQPSCV